MIPKSFEYADPATLEEALDALASNEDAKILAGGHSLIPMMKLRLAAPALLVDLRRIKDMQRISTSELGAMVTYQALLNSPDVHPLIAETAASIGDNQVRARGTIGGSAAHADPAADMTAALLALGTTMVTAHKNGGVSSREIAVDGFFTELLTTALQPNEILTSIRIPALGQRSGTAYVKIRNKASHYAVAGAAVVLTLDADGTCSHASVALTGVAASPFRLTKLEDALKGSRLDSAAFGAVEGIVNSLDIDWLSDLYGSEEYRRHLATVVAQRALQTARSRISA